MFYPFGGCYSRVSPAFHHVFHLLASNTLEFTKFGPFFASRPLRPAEWVGTAHSLPTAESYSLPTAYLQLSISTDLGNHGKSRFGAFQLKSTWNSLNLLNCWQLRVALQSDSVLLLLLSLLLVCFFYSIPRRSDRETTGKNMIYSSNNHQIIKSMGNISSIHFCFLIFLQGLHFSRSFLDTNFSLGAFRS